MKLLSLFAITLSLAGPLAGCSGWSGPGHVSEAEYVPQQGGPGYGPQGPGANVNAVPGARPPAGAAGTSGGAGATGAGGEQQAMCDLHRRLMGARSPEQRQAMIEQAMPEMSPEMQDRQLQIMRQQCQ
jgi:hypothetical protein